MAGGKKVLTKGQIVTHFAGKFEIPKKAAASMLDEYAALAIAETKKKGAFVLPGIGKSVLVKRKARIGRNPQTGKEIQIPAKTVVKICQAEACQSVGSHTLTERVATALGVELGATSNDRSVALEPVYCLGLCSCGPSMMVGEKLYARAEGKRLDGILASIPKGAH